MTAPASAKDRMAALDPADKALAEALREKLRSLLTGELTPKVLRQISETARVARELLGAGRLPPMRRGVGIQFANSGDFANAPGYDVDIDDQSDGSISFNAQSPMASSPKAETFGATLIREAVSAYADIMNRPPRVPMHEQILAISYAKSHGLDDLAKRLEANLEGSFGGGDETEGVDPIRVAHEAVGVDLLPMPMPGVATGNVFDTPSVVAKPVPVVAPSFVPTCDFKNEIDPPPPLDESPGGFPPELFPRGMSGAS